MSKVSKKAKRRFLLLLVCLFGLFVYLIVSLTGYWVKIINNHKQVKELETKYVNLLADEESLKSEVTKLQDPDYVARYASEKFLYSKDGMTIIRIVK
jgi:cell division protein FtsB